MNKSEVANQILELETDSLILQLATGVGKSLAALKLIRKWNSWDPVLVVVPKKVLIKNWTDELIKWKLDKYIPYFHFVTYVSLPKKKGMHYATVIFDEAHNLTERSAAAIPFIATDHIIMLSATISKTKLALIRKYLPNIFNYQMSTRQAIDENILPDPKVILIPLKLDWQIKDQIYVKNPRGKKTVRTTFGQSFKLSKDKSLRLEIPCTKREYYDELTKCLEYFKEKYFRTNNEAMKSLWLQYGSKRLKFLSTCKESAVYALQMLLKDYRTITFCNNIEQTKAMGVHCINSKEPLALSNLEHFNNHEINHISAVAMLDEGVNLSDCKIAIYCNLSNSDRIIQQRTGRSLRHESPYIIIPYYILTRDEEIVYKMKQLYNEKNIIECKNPYEILKYIK